MKIPATCQDCGRRYDFLVGHPCPPSFRRALYFKMKNYYRGFNG